MEFTPGTCDLYSRRASYFCCTLGSARSNIDPPGDPESHVLEAIASPAWHLTAYGLWLGLIAALLPGFGAYQAYSLMQKELGAARTGVVLYLQPLYAGAMGWLLLGQSIGMHHAVGAALILPGIYLCAAPARQRTAS